MKKQKELLENIEDNEFDFVLLFHKTKMINETMELNGLSDYDLKTGLISFYNCSNSNFLNDKCVDIVQHEILHLLGAKDVQKQNGSIMDSQTMELWNRNNWVCS